jgi:hypothetical protein
MAKVRFEFGLFPLTEIESPKPVKLSKCEKCWWGEDVGGKIFCPVIGRCVKECNHD